MLFLFRSSIYCLVWEKYDIYCYQIHIKILFLPFLFVNEITEKI